MTVSTSRNPTLAPAAQPAPAATSLRAQRLIILGSTGSIGVNTLDVVRHLNETAAARIAVVGLAAGRNVDLLIQQARAFDVSALALADEAQAQAVHRALPKAQLFIGPDASLRLVEAIDATDLSAAIVGSAGLAATVAAIKKGMRIGLANKETLVAAGAVVTPLVRQHGVTMIPVDSEHSAIFQCLQGQAGESSYSPPFQGGAGGGSSARVSVDDRSRKESALNSVSPTLPRPLPKREGSSSQSLAVKRIVLTASGGPFRTASKETIEHATVEQALKHPTWNMGPKITIDSASMMNKALEIIEAHWLFDLPGEKISVIIHPQSIMHSFVEFEDNSVLAQLGPPDMRTPIQYALTYPDRPPGCSKALDWTTLSTLEFEQPDFDRFRSLKLAYDVIEAGGTAGAVFNAANEAAVAAFLNRRIRFGRIVELAAEALSAIPVRPADSLETLWEADRQARAFVETRVNG